MDVRGSMYAVPGVCFILNCYPMQNRINNQQNDNL